MKISYQWICQSLGPAISVEQLSEDLTRLGLEVAGFERVAEPFKGVVVAEVVEVTKHPNADRLKICQLTDGDSHYQVVCAAANVRAGIRVALARVGAELPGGVVIKRSTIRQVDSCGMLCSARELTIGDDHQGILELDAKAPLGQDLRHWLALDDWVMDIELTPNRGDCFSVRGLWRELAAWYGLEFKPSPANLDKPAFVNPIALSIEAENACSRFAGVLVRGADLTQATPQWMKNRLLASGIRSLGLVVDITNYVMLELGQPLHAYDADWLQSGIVVRFAERAETITLLNGSTQVFDDKSLLIANQDQPNSIPLGLAGIMGGDSCKVSQATQEVYFEAAHFVPNYMLGKARQLGLQTDASMRFERGVDPNLPDQAVARAVELLQQVAGGEYSQLSDCKTTAWGQDVKQIDIDLDTIAKALGRSFETSAVITFLERIGIHLSSQSATAYRLNVPSHRFDLSIAEDIVEEVARFIGYQHFVSSDSQYQADLSTVNEGLSKRHCKQLLAHLGLQECICYSFVDQSIQQKMFANQALELINPIAADMNVMRLSLLPGLLQAARYNINHQHLNPHLFEVGLCFGSPQAVVNQLEDIQQQEFVATVVVNDWQQRHWLGSRAVDFYVLKGLVEKLLDAAGIAAQISFKPLHKQANIRYAHPYQTADLMLSNEWIGRVGMLHPELLDDLDLPSQVGFFEILAEPLLDQRLATRFKPFVSYPSVFRDLAVVVPIDLMVAELTKQIHSWKIEFLERVRVFDVYLDKSLQKGTKSLAISFTFRPTQATFKDHQIDALMHTIIEKFKSIGIQIRV